MKGVIQIADATCLACGCLCDDITLAVAGERIVTAERACPIGECWFLADRPTNVPVCRIEGQSASPEAGYARAAEILTAATYPLFAGLGGLACEAQRLVMGLADRLRGCVDITAAADSPLDSAIQSVGMVTATLGEVRHRADLIIFWGVDPASTHPRHFERYSLEPRGEFVPNGRADRTCVVIDSRRTATADAADVFVQIKHGANGVVVDILHTLVEGSDQLAADVEQQTEVSLDQWRDLAARMRSARYGVVFFDAATATESLLTLVRNLNRHTRFVCLPLGAAGNEAGAKQLLAWQTGHSGAVDFSGSFPRPYTGAPAPDAALVFVCGPATESLAELLPEQRTHLEHIPHVVLHSADVSPSQGFAVSFAVATLGIHATGTVFRCDGVPLPLRPAIGTPLPTSEVVLEAIERAVRYARASRERH